MRITLTRSDQRLDKLLGTRWTAQTEMVDGQCSFCGMPLRDASSVEWVDLGGGDQGPYCADSDCYRRDWNAN